MFNLSSGRSQDYALSAYQPSPVVDIQSPVLVSDSSSTSVPDTASVSTAEDIPATITELYRITAYCPCEKCCGIWASKRPINAKTGLPIVKGAAGVELTPGRSVAAPSTLPFGTKLYIPSLDKEVVVQDRVSSRIAKYYDNKVIDLYVDNHEDCYKYTGWMEVEIVQD